MSMNTRSALTGLSQRGVAKEAEAQGSLLCIAAKGPTGISNTKQTWTGEGRGGELIESVTKGHAHCFL